EGGQVFVERILRPPSEPPSRSVVLLRYVHATILRSQCHRLLQQSNLPRRRLFGSASASGVYGHRHRQLDLCSAGRLHDRHFRTPQSLASHIPLDVDLPLLHRVLVPYRRIDCQDCMCRNGHLSVHGSLLSRRGTGTVHILCRSISIVHSRRRNVFCYRHLLGFQLHPRSYLASACCCVYIDWRFLLVCSLESVRLHVCVLLLAGDQVAYPRRAGPSLQCADHQACQVLCGN
ncbi:hypothetical protein LTS18_002548, partial [Coniosporium uncinatum]